MEDKVLVVYLKKGVKKEIILNKFDFVFNQVKLKDIFEIKKIKYKTRLYKIRDGISYVRIKNFIFTDNIIIEGNTNEYIHNLVNLIFDNCIFKDCNLDVNFVSCLELKNPLFLSNDKKTANVNFFKVDCVNVNLNNNSNTDLIIEGLRGVNNFIMKSSYNNVSLTLVHPKNVWLKNISESSYLDIRSGNITIENAKIYGSRVKFYCADASRSSKLTLINSTFIDDFYCFIRTKELRLTNSLIKLDNIGYFNDLEKLYLRNSCIKANKSLFLNNLNEMIILDDKDDDTILDTSSYLEAVELIEFHDKVIVNNNYNESLIIDKEKIDSIFNDNYKCKIKK